MWICIQLKINTPSCIIDPSITEKTYCIVYSILIENLISYFKFSSLLAHQGSISSLLTIPLYPDTSQNHQQQADNHVIITDFYLKQYTKILLPLHILPYNFTLQGKSIFLQESTFSYLHWICTAMPLLFTYFEILISSFLTFANVSLNVERIVMFLTFWKKKPILYIILLLNNFYHYQKQAKLYLETRNAYSDSNTCISGRFNVTILPLSFRSIKDVQTTQ